MIKITFENGRYLAYCSFAQRMILRKAGFTFSKRLGWYTRNPGIAARLLVHCDDKTKTQIKSQCLNVEPWTGRLLYPSTKELKEWQPAACKFALSRNRSYLSIDAGLGKQIIANVLINTRGVPTVYVCPAFLVPNVIEEIGQWTTNRFLYISEPQFAVMPPDVLVVADSRLDKSIVIAEIATFLWASGQAGEKTQLIVDEAHRFKELKSQRSQRLYDLAAQFDYVTFMSGTDTPNGRPLELWAPVSKLAPSVLDFMDFHAYAKRYCAAKKKFFGWNYDGAANLEELNEKLSSFRYRLRKSDVIDSLPPKIEEIAMLEGSMPANVAAYDALCLMQFEKGKKFTLSEEDEDAGYSKYRKALGLAKVKPAIKFIRGAMESTDESFIIFAHHIEVMKELVSGLYDLEPYFITAETPKAERTRVIKDFQNDKKRHPLIVNIKAGGIGLTATRASQVIFVESSPVPADNSQASDRAHRIGQTLPVYVRYLVFRNSFEKAHLANLLTKTKVIAQL